MAAPTTNLDRSTTVTLANPTPPTNVAVDYQGTPPTPAGLVPVGAGVPAATGAFADPLEGTGKAEADGTEVSVTTPGGRVTTTSTLGDYTEFPQRDHPSSSGETGGGGEAVELVTNGTFDDATGWGLTSGAVISGGVLILDDNGDGLCMADTDAAETITPGDYVWSLDMGGVSPNQDIYVFIGGVSERVSATGGALGHYEGMITTTAADQKVMVTGFDNANSTTIDNLSVKRAP
jgi:hypothetical protein